MSRKNKALEVWVSGENACRALFETRPDAVVRVYLTEARIPGFKALLEHCVQRRLAYHVVPSEEVEAVSETRHHEGICIVARRPTASFDDLLDDEGPMTVLVLDRVENPHNLGAILRTAAHFEVRAVLTDASVRLTPAAYRIAEGGAEHTVWIGVPDLPQAVDALKEAGMRVVATTHRTTRSLFDERFSARTVLLIGNERDGLSSGLLQKADGRVAIPGTGHVESLNVSAATSAVLTELYRQRVSFRGRDDSGRRFSRGRSSSGRRSGRGAKGRGAKGKPFRPRR